MTEAGPTKPSKISARSVAEIAPYALTIGAVVLAWQIAIQPLVQRAPVGLALRLAPGSAQTLSRAAEAELAADRNDNAAELARRSLATAPFNVRALRVFGLTEARAGRVAHANEVLTLAGNWSLRDDPSHAWLIEHRLRRGDYASAFAHADTLARRERVWPELFSLFTTAAATDTARALPVLARLLSNNPPWRSAYLTSLYETTDGLRVAGALAIVLERGAHPLNNTELEQLYVAFLGKGQIAAIQSIRTQLDRPPAATVTNGGFDDPASPQPFQWTLVQEAGAVADALPDDIRRDPALRVEYSGRQRATIARQQIFLAPGRYRFGSEFRIESGEPDGQLTWSISCAAGIGTFLELPIVGAGVTAESGWRAMGQEFSVPADCTSQWLDLLGQPSLDRRSAVVWFDRISVAPASSNRPSQPSA